MKNSKYSKLIVLVLIFTILFNFLGQTKTYAAGVPIAMIYGVPMAEKLIAFIFAALAVGVTYKTLDDAKAAFDAWLADLPEYEPPRNDNGSGNGWKDSIIELLKVGTIAGALRALWEDVKSYYISLGSREGENIYEVLKFSDDYFIGNYNNRWYRVTDGTIIYPSFVNKKYFIIGGYRKFRYVRFHIYKVGNDIFLDGLIVGNEYDGKDNYLGEYRKEINGLKFYQIKREWNYGFVGIGYELLPNPSGSMPIAFDEDISFRFLYVDDTNEEPLNPGGLTEIPYYVKPDSPVLTDTDPYDDIWYQPNIYDIVPTKTVINKNGIKETVYEGTTDDLVNDIINNITFEDIQNSIKREPYDFIETDTGLVVEADTEAPFPEPDTEPIEDTSQFQGETVGLLKSIINWLSKIYNNISELPQKIGDLFFNPENVESIDFSPITNVSISEKFPFSIPWDLKKSVEKLSAEAKPPKWEIPIVSETITIDMAEFEHLANIMRIFNTLLFLVALIILTKRVI